MLLELRIRNFAVIEEVDVRLAPGFNVLTGETGAGKSIIVDALSLLVGERASSEVVRAGTDRAVVEAVFDASSRPEVRGVLEEQGIDAEVDGTLILRREVALEGRNRSWVNGSPTTAAVVGTLGRLLVDLHGQHEHQTLLRAEEQRAILDGYDGATELAAQVRAAYQRYQRARQRLEGLEQRRREVEQRLDLLRFQVDEIEGARIRPDEEAELEAEIRRLDHAEELATMANELYHGLYASEHSVSARLDELRRLLGRLARLDPDQADAGELLDSAYYALEELGRRMGDYAGAVEQDPHRLEMLRARQDLLLRLRRKYGPTLADVIETGRRARAELEELDGLALDRRTLERDVDHAREELERLAAELGARRVAAATSLAADVNAILPEVGLAGGRFEIGLTPQPEIGADGAEAVEFRVALNAGFEPKPLARTASGGEISRIMLALKATLARLDRVPSLVFDEIDAGIGGRVALQIADKLRDVAAHHQVFAITHLPQIASRADHHLRVEKINEGGVATTRVVELTGEARVRELARMLSGDMDGPTGLQHARELLDATVAAGGD